MGTRVAEAVDRAGVAGLLLVDLDRFKAVNDTHGHTAGDTVLRCVAARLRAGLLPGEHAARHGGDEFSVLLTATTQPWAARRADVIAHAVAGPVALPSGAVTTVRASVGHAIANQVAALWEAADDAMYQAKRSTRTGALRVSGGVQ
jgi:diguanylate cyclase (GGDEF) domain